MNKVKLTMFVGPMGHDVARSTERIVSWMNDSGAFDVTLAGTVKGAVCGIREFMFNSEYVANTDVFFFNCGDEEWQDAEIRKKFEDAISSGKGLVAYHGIHPGFQGWEAFERMCGLMWRHDSQHGDYNDCHVRMDMKDHPIVRGLSDFDTRDELFCNLDDMWGVDFQVLATAFSDYNICSRHGFHGTGRHEPVATIGNYGKGRVYNHIIGHVWPFYTGHGLGENTMLSYEPPEFRKMLLRGCEWAATGKVEMTE